MIRSAATRFALALAALVSLTVIGCGHEDKPLFHAVRDYTETARGAPADAAGTAPLLLAALERVEVEWENTRASIDDAEIARRIGDRVHFLRLFTYSLYLWLADDEAFFGEPMASLGAVPEDLRRPAAALSPEFLDYLATVVGSEATPDLRAWQASNFEPVFWRDFVGSHMKTFGNLYEILSIELAAETARL